MCDNDGEFSILGFPKGSGCHYQSELPGVSTSH